MVYDEKKIAFDLKLDWILFIGKDTEKENFKDKLERRISVRARTFSKIGISANVVGVQESARDALPGTSAASSVREREAVELSSEDDDESNDASDDASDEDYQPPSGTVEKLISRTEAVRVLMSDQHLLAQADREKKSDVSLAREGALFAKALNVPLSSVQGVSASTVKRKRTSMRDSYAEQYEEEFVKELHQYPEKLLCVHWDGKLMKNSTGGLLPKVDRVPIVVSGLPTTWLLEVGRKKAL